MCVRERILCMHDVHACITCMHIMHAGLLVMHACMHLLYAYHVCMHFWVHAQYACMLVAPFICFKVFGFRPLAPELQLVILGEIDIPVASVCICICICMHIRA